MKHPLLPHVDPARLSSLETELEDLSRLSADFLILLAGSTVIATLGLFQNSPAVIIGAMIIAPLMRPLVGLSLASLTADALLLRRALITLFAGTFIGGFIAYAIASMLHSISLTPEILGRTRPTLLDLGVAFFAGAVGAYCQTNEKLSNTLAGVAIAVALVPPLSVVGIGLASNSASVWGGAALLYATNLVGIAFAAAVVFLVMGYTPLQQARKGLAISAVFLCLLMVPLGFSMRELFLENALSRSIRSILEEKTYTFKNLHVENVEVRRFQRPMSVSVTAYGGEQTVTPQQVKLVQDFLVRETGIPIDFRLRIVPSTEIGAVEVTSSGQSLTRPAWPVQSAEPSSLRKHSTEPAATDKVPAVDSARSWQSSDANSTDGSPHGSESQR